MVVLLTEVCSCGDALIITSYFDNKTFPVGEDCMRQVLFHGALEQVAPATSTASRECRILKAQNVENREYLCLMNNQEHNLGYRRNN